MTGTIDPNGDNGGPVLDNNVTNGTYTWTTYAERLNEAGVSWKVYQQDDNYGTQRAGVLQAVPEAPDHLPAVPERAWPRSRTASSNTTPSTTSCPPCRWIFPTSTQSEHPDFMPAAGAAFVASKIDAIAANPEVWAKTVFILNYDENDGLFDHVAPPDAAGRHADEFVS